MAWLKLPDLGLARISETFMKSGLILRDVSKELNAFVPSNHRKMMLRFRSSIMVG